jgi:xanthine dehydrogenase molybdopterin-binding subunit B
VLSYPESADEASTYTLHSIFDRLLTTSSYLHRAESTKQFNNCNKWRKRGISCVPLILKVAPRTAHGRVSVLNDGSIVVEVGGVEIGQGLWTKVQQMTVFALGQLWPDGCEFLLDRMHVLQADTLNLIQGGLTVGSTSAESSCAATLEACNMLVDRLKPVTEKLRQQPGGAVSWDALIAQVICLFPSGFLCYMEVIYLCVEIVIFKCANTWSSYELLFPNRPLRIMIICPRVHTGYLAKNPVPI